MANYPNSFDNLPTTLNPNVATNSPTQDHTVQYIIK